MSESTPPYLVEGPHDGVAETVNADTVERVLADFRAWLTEQPDASAVEPSKPESAIDLAAMVAPFVALRHEVNLQTKASRAQLEQNTQALEVLRQAVESLRRPAPNPAAADDAVRPLLKTLIDVHDALSLARREVRKLQDALPREYAVPPVPQPFTVRLPFWARWLGLAGPVHSAVTPVEECQKACVVSATFAADLARMRQKVDAMLTGYAMGLQRIERAIEQNGLERVACIGEPFDPEIMEVAEVVRDPERDGTDVIDELRPGYRWRGRLFRYAQVRVARP